MSTKTLRKRIALVAVAALGFGLVSGTPANAGTGTANNYTSGLAFGWSALTVTSDATTATNGFFYVDSTNVTLPLVSTNPTAQPLQTTETMNIDVISAPTGRAVTDLNITSVKNATTAFNDAFVVANNNTDGDESLLVTDSTVVATGSDAASPNGSFSATANLNNEANRYWFAVNTDTAAALGAGKYTIRVRLTNANSQVIDYTMTVKFVASIADAGAVLTLAKTGSITTGVAFAQTSNTSVTATLRDADGGRIHVGQAQTGTRAGWVTPLNGNMMDTAVGEVLTGVLDSGVTAEDHVACGTGGAAACGVTPSGGLSQLLSASNAALGDGVYGVSDSAIAATASSTSEVRIRVNGTSVTASIAISVITATTAVLTGTQVKLAATGIAAADTEFRDITIASGAGTIAYTLPVAATTAKLTVDAGTTVTAGQALTATTTWSGNYATANVTPASANVQTVFTDASGRVVIDLTNSSPVAGAVATVKITGFATVTESLTITSTWAAATVTSLTILDPADGIYAKTKSATVFSIEVDDQFGNPIAGAQITPSLSSTSANYSATTTYAPVTTGANGIATWTLTDAAATDILGDSITFTSVVGAKTATYSLTYKATLPVVSSMTGFRSDALQNVAETVALRGTSISSSAGVTGTLSIARDLSKSLAAFADVTASGDDMYAIRIRAVTSTGAAATGAPVTLKSSTGAWLQDVSGLPVTSRTVAAGVDGDAYFRILATATGTHTFTATSGTASFAFPMTIADQTNAAGRFVTITGATTGTANGAGVPISATVTDRYGNGVANVTLTVTASGVGAFMGGQTSQSFTTDATGKYTFLATSYNAAGGAATYSVNATNATDATSVAGYSSTTVIDSTVKAGNKAASVTITFADGANASEVAATAAAQDAADAVAALATQVSEMMDAMKKQITALTNLVIKIQKKVKA